MIFRSRSRLSPPKNVANAVPPRRHHDPIHSATDYHSVTVSPFVSPRKVSLHGSITLESTVLYAIRVDARRSASGKLTVSGTLTAIEVDVFEVKGVDVAGEIPKQG